MHRFVSLRSPAPRCCLVAAAALIGTALASAQPPSKAARSAAAASQPAHKLDRSGHARVGKASFQDRGPYVRGRILDVSPSTARQLGITRDDGVAKVEVAPIVVPQPDGGIKPGAAWQR